jgi:hypothetical protein
VAADDKEHEILRSPPEPPPPPLNGDMKDRDSDKPLSHSQRTTPVVQLLTSPAIVETYLVHSRRPSQEDGEILNPSPPPKQKRHTSFVPRSHTPPTQPRSFRVRSTSPPVSTPSPSASAQGRRPSQPPPPSSQSYRPQVQTPTQSSIYVGSRPLPSGPRALRTANPGGHYPPSRPSPGLQPHFIPRGPYADRERLEWDRERGWPPRTRGRGSGSSSGWGR